MDYMVIPDFVERKGSLYLRCNHMNYSRGTLNSNWHQAREAEPKRYDINLFPKPPGRNLHTATYERMGCSKTKDFPKTTTKEAMEQLSLKPDFTEKEIHKSMVDFESFGHAYIDRELDAPARGYGAVLPRHHPDHDKMHLETTHKADFTPPYPYDPAPPRPDSPDNSKAYRRYQSQFTDTADYRRSGRNTWQDESGVYGNAEEKRDVYPRSNPIPDRLIQGLK